MKRILLITSISFFCIQAFSQTIPTIKASEAKSYVGKEVYLQDKIQSGKVVTDSLVVLKVGGLLDKDACFVVISSKGTEFNLDSRIITTSQIAHAEFRGIITPIGACYAIIIDGKNRARDIILKGPSPE